MVSNKKVYELSTYLEEETIRRVNKHAPKIIKEVLGEFKDGDLNVLAMSLGVRVTLAKPDRIDAIVKQIGEIRVR